VAEHLPNIHEALDSISSAVKERKNEKAVSGQIHIINISPMGEETI
jgi:hypothetical protein